MLQRTFRSWLSCAALACLGLVGLVRPAHAYIDPGTGSIILQTIIGGVAAGAIAIKLYWSKVKARFFPARGRQGPGANRTTKHGSDGDGA